MRYDASDVGAQQIGYVAENSVLHTAFLRQLSRPGRPPVFQYPVSLSHTAILPNSASKMLSIRADCSFQVCKFSVYIVIHLSVTQYQTVWLNLRS